MPDKTDRDWPDKHQKGFNSWTHLVSMLFCQFVKSKSVRDICLKY